MSNIRDYLKSKEIDKYEMSKQDSIYMVIAAKCLDKTINECLLPLDISISKKEELEYNIQSVCGWERTSNGFEYRNNFHLDKSGRDILFDRYFVTKSNDKFESDGSIISDNFIKNNSKKLKSLTKIYQVYDMLAKEFETDVREREETVARIWQIHGGEARLAEKAYLKHRHTAMYFDIYGELGKKILIKWLNELSDTQKSMDELLAEFTKDINEANMYFDEHLDKNKSKHYQFEYVLLVELMQYSPRGKILRSMYRNMNINENNNVKENHVCNVHHY